MSFDEEDILKCILNGDKERLAGGIAETFENFRSHRIRDYDYINRASLEALFVICRKMLRYNVRPEKIMLENNCAYTDIYRKHTLEGKQGKYSKTGMLARQIRAIVDEEYMSNGISLEYVAEKVHKNTAYISKIFKNEFDCNFSIYVTDKRLEKSRELLGEPGRKIYEIAGALGWADVSNFIKVFHKKYRISPEEYRKISSGKFRD